MNKHNTVLARSVRYIQQVFPWAHMSRRRKRHLDRLFASAVFAGLAIGDRPTNRPTDHATRSVTIGGAHIEAKFCYCLRLLQVFIGAVDSTDRINFSKQQLYSALRLDGLQCMWRHTTIIIASKTAFPTGVTDR